MAHDPLRPKHAPGGVGGAGGRTKSGPRPAEHAKLERPYGFLVAIAAEAVVLSQRSLDGIAFCAERGAVYAEGADMLHHISQALGGRGGSDGWVGAAAQAYGAQTAELRRLAKKMADADREIRRHLDAHYEQIEIACRLLEVYCSLLVVVIAMTRFLDMEGEHALSLGIAVPICGLLVSECLLHQAALVRHSKSTASALLTEANRYRDAISEAATMTRMHVPGTVAYDIADQHSALPPGDNQQDAGAAAGSGLPATPPTSRQQPGSTDWLAGAASPGDEHSTPNSFSPRARKPQPTIDEYPHFRSGTSSTAKPGPNDRPPSRPSEPHTGRPVAVPAESHRHYAAGASCSTGGRRAPIGAGGSAA